MPGAYTREEMMELLLRTAQEAAVNVFANPRRAAIARAARSGPALARSAGGNYDETGAYVRAFQLDGSSLDGPDGLR